MSAKFHVEVNNLGFWRPFHSFHAEKAARVQADMVKRRFPGDRVRVTVRGVVIYEPASSGQAPPRVHPEGATR